MGLKCLYKENGDSVTILRCYGEYGRIVLPESINGKKVTELGDYIFSEDMRHKPEGKIWMENGTSEERCADENTAACGSRVREICLPSTIKKIGRYAFYNCYSLKKLAMFSTAVDIGAGAFNGCRQIDELTIGVIKGERSCLKEVLAELNESLTVFYRQYEKSGDGELKCTGRAQLCFPFFMRRLWRIHRPESWKLMFMAAVTATAMHLKERNLSSGNMTVFLSMPEPRNPRSRRQSWLSAVCGILWSFHRKPA